MAKKKDKAKKREKGLRVVRSPSQSMATAGMHQDQECVPPREEKGALFVFFLILIVCTFLLLLSHF